ncbi:DC-STAMP domain-containing protein 2-like isoform X3 [Convolutriloba macropyga]|uniref:DC-STAMP domain-containing protein 2-like isoform X3 n=1 Tax=Convolutriloba macropyga TaxID=536237 RepID=UPI003F51BCA5
MYRVVKNFEASNDSEISLSIGQTLSEVTVNENVGTVSVDGKTGTFPMDHVAMVHNLPQGTVAPAGPVAKLKAEEGVISFTDYSTDSDSDVTGPAVRTDRTLNRTYTPQPQPTRSNSGRYNKKYQRSLSLPKNSTSEVSSSAVDSPDDASSIITEQSNQLNTSPPTAPSLYTNDDGFSRDLFITDTKGSKNNHPPLAPQNSKTGSISSLSRTLSKTLSKENISLHAQHLSSSGGRDHLCLKMTFAFLMSSLTGGVILGSLYVGGKLSAYEAAYVAGSFSLLSFCLLLISRKTRAVYAIMLPSLCATRGQTVIMSLAFSFIFSHHVQAILTNMEQVGRSMACHSELAYNQSLQVIELYMSPLAGLQEQFKMSVAKLEKLKDIYADPVKTVTGILDDTADNLEKIRKELEKFQSECEKAVNGMDETCSEVFKDLQMFCGAFKEDKECTTTCDQEGEDNIVIDRRRRRRDASQKSGSVNSTSPKSEEHKPDYYCLEEEAENVCEGARDIAKIAGCYPAGETMSLVNDCGEFVQKASRIVTEQFYYEIVYDFDTNGTSRQSSNATAIEERIVHAFENMQPILEIGSKIVSIIMACFFLTILHKSYSYISKFVQDTSFDNHYLNETLEKYLTDGKRKLRRSEVRKLVRIWQWKRTPTENKRLFYSIVTSAVYTSIALSILFFNAFFYYTLKLIREYGESETTFEGSVDFEFQVKGDGLMRDVVDMFIESYDFTSNLTTTANNEQCLPDPVRPNNEVLVNTCVFGCFMLFYFTIIAQTWVLRFRHIICGMFFEGSEEARLHYLVNKLSYQIHNRDVIIAQNVLRSFREDKTRQQFLEFGVLRQITKLSRGVHGYCFACRRTAWGRHKRINCSEHFLNCHEITVKATFCIPCSFEIFNSCILCKLDIVDLESIANVDGSNLFGNYAFNQRLEIPTLMPKQNKVGPAPINDDYASSKA